MVQTGGCAIQAAAVTDLSVVFFFCVRVGVCVCVRLNITRNQNGICSESARARR